MKNMNTCIHHDNYMYLRNHVVIPGIDHPAAMAASPASLRRVPNRLDIRGAMAAALSKQCLPLSIVRGASEGRNEIHRNNGC